MSSLPDYLQELLDDVCHEVDELIYSINHPIAHMLPINDLRPHELNIECWCKPQLDEDTCVHNALDKRDDLLIQ